MGTLFDHPYAPSTLGSFLRQFTFGHVRQLDAVASRFLHALAQRTPVVAGITGGRVLVDIDDSIIEVHGHSKQGSGYGYSRVRGLNSLITTVTTDKCAPVILGQRLRKGSCGSPRGAARMVADTLATVGRLRSTAVVSANPEAPSAVPKPLLRADSAFYGHPTLGAAVRAGADVSVSTGLSSVIRTAMRSPLRRKPTAFRAGWSCAASPTCDPRKTKSKVNCSTCGGFTPSSPPPPRRSGYRGR